jgi:PD-(D/E)XK nuclease superfamily
LRLVPGIELWTHREDESQFGFEDFGGRFKGHIDGVIRGLFQAPKTPHIWENKSVNDKKFKLLQKSIAEKGEKNALKAWDPIYYAQGVIYMHYFDLTRHYLTVTTPGGRDIASCRTEANPAYAEALREKAKRILNAAQQLARISDNPSWHECKWCPFWETCRVVPVSAAGTSTQQNEW